MLKQILKAVAVGAGSLIGLAGLYFGCQYCLSRIAVNRHPARGDDVTIYILTNGAHTDIVVPLTTEAVDSGENGRNLDRSAPDAVDWMELVNMDDTAGKDRSAAYAAFGWGDKGFYMEIPTWDDLTFRVAFRATFGLSSTAMHVTFYRQMTEGSNCVAIPIGRREYGKLVRYISDSFRKGADGRAIHIETDANYGTDDAFYEAKGRYNLFFTCNTWANGALKSCGQKASLWTAFDKGIFYQYK